MFLRSYFTLIYLIQRKTFQENMTTHTKAVFIVTRTPAWGAGGGGAYTVAVNSNSQDGVEAADERLKAVGQELQKELDNIYGTEGELRGNALFKQVKDVWGPQALQSVLGADWTGSAETIEVALQQVE